MGYLKLWKANWKILTFWSKQRGKDIILRKLKDIEEKKGTFRKSIKINTIKTSKDRKSNMTRPQTANKKSKSYENPIQTGTSSNSQI